tara:strand:- start:4064 stop:4915 length:852 start_codon:yes stop_codon:yes gene_type:complete
LAACSTGDIIHIQVAKAFLPSDVVSASDGGAFASNISAPGLTLGTTPLAVASGGTGSSTAGAALTALGGVGAGANSSITSLTGLTTPLTVAQGGSGAATHTANGVLLGAGTGAVTTAAPGASGQVLTSNGTVWASAAAPAGVILYSAVDTSTSTVTSTGYTDTGSEITFTPASASSKLLVTLTSSFGGKSTYQEANMHNYWQIRDITNSVDVANVTNHQGNYNAGDQNEDGRWQLPGAMQAVYDSPGTSAITLQCRTKTSHATYYTTYFGYSPGQNVWTVLEI